MCSGILRAEAVYRRIPYRCCLACIFDAARWSTTTIRASHPFRDRNHRDFAPSGPGQAQCSRPGLLLALIHRSAWRNCLENRDESRNRGSESGQKGSKGHRSAASCRQRSPVEGSSAIFQTVSEGVFCELRLYRILGRSSVLRTPTLCDLPPVRWRAG